VARGERTRYFCETKDTIFWGGRILKSFGDRKKRFDVKFWKGGERRGSDGAPYTAKKSGYR